MKKNKNKYKTLYSIDVINRKGDFSSIEGIRQKLFIVFNDNFYLKRDHQNDSSLFYKTQSKEYFINRIVSLFEEVKNKKVLKEVLENSCNIFEKDYFEKEEFINNVGRFCMGIILRYFINEREQEDGHKIYLSFLSFNQFYRLYLLNLVKDKEIKFKKITEKSRLYFFYQDDIEENLSYKEKLLIELLKTVRITEGCNLKIQEGFDKRYYLSVGLKYENKDFLMTHIKLDKETENKIKFSEYIKEILDSSKNVSEKEKLIFLGIMSYHIQGFDFYK